MILEDAELADIIIDRLNKLCEQEEVRADIGRLLETRIAAGPETRNHPTIQVQPSGAFGLLGLLNGLVGVIPAGSHAGWGYIAAVYYDDGSLKGFKRSLDVMVPILVGGERGGEGERSEYVVPVRG